jgi:predicted helicase
MTTIHEVLDGLRGSALDERDKGFHFESLSKKWLEISPEYADVFDKVWFYGDWAEENGLPRNDVGIDLVARDRETKELCAIQCKFYGASHTVEKKHIDSFFTALSKKHFQSGLIFSTSERWSKNAEAALAEISKPVVRVGLHDLEDSGVDWSKFNISKAAEMVMVPKKEPFEHQKKAINEAISHFSAHDRGKLVMACGTGKTFTSLQIAERLVPDGGTMLFLVPSIALLSQSLKEWKRESSRPMTAYAVCSDSKVGKTKDDEDIQVTDLAYPATTDTKKLAGHFTSRAGDKNFTVIFSTYQSIDVVAKAQKEGVPEFDLVICDEAHRTTGLTLAGSDESSFVRVHDNKFLKAKKRLYMTATPRIYLEQTKQKAQEVEAEVVSMDDEDKFGEEFHRLNFGEAVTEGLLSDYKVLVLAVSQDHVSRQLQKLLTKDGELNLDDATKIVGCYNGLRKRSSELGDFAVDPAPMKSAVAFSRSIKDSQKLADLFEVVTNTLNLESNEEDPLIAEADHVDGTYNMEARLDKLDWLKDTKTENTVRILSNARCLSEGVDVPALDAVLFLNPRDSQVDVVQSVGRVMRKSPGKNYGYVILPIAVPAGTTAEEALADNKSYRVVWQVLQALRSHDERFNAEVNRIDLNNDAGERIKIIGIGGTSDEDSVGKNENSDTSLTLDFDLGEWKDAILAKIVQKVGQRTYWETWAGDVAKIAQNNISRISSLLETSDSKVRREFEQFVRGLQDNLNPYVTEAEAIEMLAQHIITKPVFDALFEGYSFAERNPVSAAMQKMLSILEKQSIGTDYEKLEKFYDSVRVRASGITDAGAKQKIIKELYEKFFRIAFSGTSDRLGIVYTPNEIVDFIIRSADAALRQEFGTSLSAPGVQILDPFTGTGTFIVRLLQSGLIDSKVLRSKYKAEIHANELVLLAYYVAAINIEETFHGIVGGDYEPFNGIVLTDTFQMNEGDDKDELPGMEVFPENNERVLAQKNQVIQVIIGNPPYSVGQSSGNDNNANIDYPHLDSRIDETYAQGSTASLKKSLHDSYIRAFRWASDRIGDKGIVAFVSNGGFIDSNSADGFRKSLLGEFDSVYVYNLRGNQRTAGEESRKEGGKVFGGGSRNTIAITLLVRNPESKTGPKLKYRDIGDYLSREQKLSIVDEQKSIANVPWDSIVPNEHGDWVGQRDVRYGTYIPLASKVPGEASVFKTNSRGVLTARDSWAVNYSKTGLAKNMRSMIDFYNAEATKFQNAVKAGQVSKTLEGLRGFVNRDTKKISWDGSLEASALKGKLFTFDEKKIVPVMYRAFSKQWLYLDRDFNNSVYQMPRLFPSDKSNFGLYCVGMGSSVPFSTLISDIIPDVHLTGAGSGGQFFARFNYESETSNTDGQLFVEVEDEDNITDEALSHFQAAFPSATKDDVFYYVYGVLHSAEYRERYAGDLKKMLPRIPVSRNFFEFAKAGKALANLHSTFDALDGLGEVQNRIPSPSTVVSRMKFAKSGGKEDKSVIEVNADVKIVNIPLAAYNYHVGSKSAIEWVIERYQNKLDKATGISNDPNSGVLAESGATIVQLLRSVIHMSVQSWEIISRLPSLDTE